MTTEGGAANGAASDPDARWHVGPTAQTGLLRYDQTFPTLTAAEIERLRRFGTVRSHPDGAYLFRAGTPSSGMLVVLSGSVAISNHDGLGHVLPMIEQGPGQFVGEIGQLSGARSVVDGRAEGATEVLLIAPDQIRALMVAEAELGERVMRALILRRVVLIESGVGGPVIIGSPTAFEVIRLQIFLGRNSQPYHVLDPATDAEAAQFVALHARSPGDLPLVVCPDGTVLRCPNRMELAHQLGMVGRLPTDRVYDVAIVGCGPAGLSTAVYAASEGLSVVVLDALAIGGQAGASARIENYFGFPTGISGLALTSRAYVQAQKFGAEILIPVVVESLDCIRADGYFGLAVDGGERIRSRAVVVASGARYRRPKIDNLAAFEGRGVSYWASPVEARLCAGREIVIVGGGNSAGQAAVFLAGHARRIRMMVRGPGLAETMSRYMIDRLAATPNLELMTRTEVVALEGSADAGLERIRWRNNATSVEGSGDISSMFVFVGADPATAWLAGCGVELDRAGFVLTPARERSDDSGSPGDELDRPLETTVPGVFAVGDVRSGSVKRVGNAIGEGSRVVPSLHRYLAANPAPAPARPQRQEQTEHA